jgi:hypothetical protein
VSRFDSNRAGVNSYGGRLIVSSTPFLCRGQHTPAHTHTARVHARRQVKEAVARRSRLRAEEEVRLLVRVHEVQARRVRGLGRLVRGREQVEVVQRGLVHHRRGERGREQGEREEGREHRGGVVKEGGPVAPFSRDLRFIHGGRGRREGRGGLGPPVALLPSRSPLVFLLLVSV